MRFDDLFDDLESQLEAELAGQERATDAEGERFRVGRLEVRDRILQAPRSLDVRLRSRARLRVERLTVGRDWLSGTVREGQDGGSGCIVPLAAIVGVRLDDDAVARSLASAPERAEPPRLTDRLSFGYALRDLARRRVAVELRCPDALHGTIDRVGRDHLDLAVHDPGTARHPREVRSVELVPFAAIDWVRLP